MSGRGPVSALLISVGGSPEPVAFSIRHHRPERIIFFASADSRRSIQAEIRERVDGGWRDQEVITAPDPQDLVRCMEELARSLPEKLRVLGIAPDNLVVDYTGGTKTMSAALVLATINLPVRYSYVGGSKRGKDGLGTVLEGGEAVLYSPNPWDVLALDLERRIASRFNAARFADARDVAREAAGRVGSQLRPRFEGLERLCEAYWRWDTFDYPAARTLLRQGLGKIRPYHSAHDDRWRGFLDHVEADGDRLEPMNQAFGRLQRGEPAEPGAIFALIVNLVANAERTMRRLSRPDDAVARLYSALEKLAKHELLHAHGIDNSRVTADQLPEALRDEYLARYGSTGSAGMKMGLAASYRLLHALDSPVGQKYIENEGALADVLGRRNGSLMVHGWAPIKGNDFDRLLALTCGFLGFDAAALPAPPRMPE